jgi:hypothetical protein
VYRTHARTPTRLLRGQFDETRETLLYANRAKNITVTESMLKTRRQANVDPKTMEYEKARLSTLSAPCTTVVACVTAPDLHRWSRTCATSCRP